MTHTPFVLYVFNFTSGPDYQLYKTIKTDGFISGGCTLPPLSVHHQMHKCTPSDVEVYTIRCRRVPLDVRLPTLVGKSTLRVHTLHVDILTTLPPLRRTIVTRVGENIAQS